MKIRIIFLVPHEISLREIGPSINRNSHKQLLCKTLLHKNSIHTKIVFPQNQIYENGFFHFFFCITYHFPCLLLNVFNYDFHHFEASFLTIKELIHESKTHLCTINLLQIKIQNELSIFNFYYCIFYFLMF